MSKQYRLFFSWQNDRKATKTVILKALRNVEAQLKTEGLELFIDQDTRERVGKRNIDAEVLEKIRKCDIFLADLTPVTTYLPPVKSHDLPKHMPNSNVMYEYGYALHAKGANRMIVLAALNKEENEHIEYMPFDINHDTITLFSDEYSLRGLYDWIKRIIVDVDKQRAAKIPQYACALQFITNEVSSLFTGEIIIRPKYKRIHYTSKSLRRLKHNNDSLPIAETALNPFKKQQGLINQFLVPSALQVATAKVIHKETNYSYVPVSMVFTNHGCEALDNVKLSIQASDERVIFDSTNEHHSLPLSFPSGIYATSISEKMIFQEVATINPHDSVFLHQVFIHAPHDIGSFNLIWSLSSRTYRTEGQLTIHIEPEYENESLENDEMAGTESVEDYKVGE